MDWLRRAGTTLNIKVSMTICILVVLLLSGKNPFDDQSLIPNLEPYPDSLYYAYPAWNVAHGGEFSMTYHGDTFKNATPPLFSLYLLPFFAIFKDIRVFYFAQLALMFITVMLLIKILDRIVGHFKVSKVVKTVMITFVGLIFVTNFYIYTMPSLLMAELISIALVLAACLLVLLPTHSLRASLSGHIAALFLLSKISNLPLTATFYCLFLLKTWHSSERKKFIIHSCIAILYSGLYFYTSGFFEGHKNLHGNNFSLENISRHLPFYLKTMMGYPTRYVWYTERLVSPFASLGAACGIAIGYMMKETRNTVRGIVFGTAALVIFMSSFITPDARYISVLIPFYSILMLIALIGFYKKVHTRYFFGGIALLLVLYFMLPAFSYSPGESHIVTMKKQIGLNYLHPENPWNYNAVVEMSTFSLSQEVKKPIYIATFLPQFYVGMFTENFIALPITTKQEFYSEADQQKILKMYEDAFASGTVYLSNSYIGNISDVWPDEFEKIKEKYRGTRVYEGCLGTCNLYLLRSSPSSDAH